MFVQLNPGTLTQRKVLGGSLALHGLLFAWLLHTPEPQLLTPTSIALGRNGQVVAHLYFPTRSPDDSTTSSSDSATQVYRHQRLGHEKLAWTRTSTPARLPMPPAPVTPNPAEDSSKTATLSKAGHGALAGLPYGSLPGGPVYGDEIRPALPIVTSDPVVYPWQQPESEGKVVIEITIDERGEIVRKTVLQSLGSEIDNKCLAALENWHFHPATHNGAPIASKQDAIFPFKARSSAESGSSSPRPPAAIING
jgi:TonB family protein